MANVEKTWKTSYGNHDHHQMIGEIIVDYFNELGQKIINSRNSGIKIVPYKDINPIYVRNMVKMGMACGKLTGEFNCGKESEISKILFNTGSMDYREYIEKIYQTLCNGSEEDWRVG